MISFSIRLKEILKSRGMSQIELAEKAQTTAATISRYLSNDRTPNIELLNNIASVLNVTTDYLLGKTDDPAPQNKKAPPKSVPDIQWGDFGISFSGTPSEEDKEMIIDSINFAMEQRRKRHEAKAKEQQDKK